MQLSILKLERPAFVGRTLVQTAYTDGLQTPLVFAGTTIRDYYQHSMSLAFVHRRTFQALIPLWVTASIWVGCGQERPSTSRSDSVAPRHADAAVEVAEPIVIEWQSIVATVGQAVELTTHVVALLHASLVQEIAGLCRLDGWNNTRTTGYRERGWRLKKRTGPTRTRRLVLTFDDGPMKKKTPKILDLLAKYKVKATFFVVGRVIHAGTYRLVKRVLKEGHTLANHTYHHWVDMHKHKQAADFVEADLELTQAMVDLALLAKSWRDFRALRIRMLGGKKFDIAKQLPGAWPAIRARWKSILAERSPDGQSPYRMVFVRPPGGAPFSTRWRRRHRVQYARTLRKLGLINVMWDEDSGDSDRMLTVAERRDPGRLEEAILDGTKRGGVFLMHDRIGLGGFGLALRKLRTRKRVVLTDLPAAARSWYGCEPRTLSLVLQTLYAVDYRAPKPPVVTKRPRPKPVVKKKGPRKRRRKRRRVRPRARRRTSRRARRKAPRRRVVRHRAQGLTPRRR